jgi:preprotein translocase subunit SecG
MSVNLLLIFFVLIVVAMIAFILVQKGSGATAGSAFGSGASNTVFGAKGSGNFLTKTTMILAFLFFAISMFMAVQASKEFTTATTGAIDLGVVGQLDTSDSDVPSIKPSVPVEGDVPTLTEKVLDNATEIKETTVEKAGDLKDSAIEKVDEVKEAVEEEAAELEEKIDG